MILVALGLFMLLGANLVLGSFLRNAPQTAKFKQLIQGVGVILIIVGALSKSVVQIQAGTVGVKSLFGKISPVPIGEGLSLINPLMEVHKLDIKTQNYTMSGILGEGQKSGDDAIQVLTKDGLEVVIDLSILYRLVPNETPKLMQKVGEFYREKIVRPVARTKVRDNAVYYEAVQLYGNKRDEFQDKIFKAMDKEFQKRGIMLENLLVRNIKLPQSVKTSIEEKISAEQDAQKMEFVLQKEKQEAERKRVEAQGIADYQRIINQGLTRNQLQYEQIKAYKEMATSENAKIIVIPNKTPVILDGK